MDKRSGKILDKLIIERLSLSLSGLHPAGEMALVDAYKRRETERDDDPD